MNEIPMDLAMAIMQILGLPGMVFIIWHFDNKRDQRKEELHRDEIAEREKALALTLAQYREDVGKIRHLYENNARLVDDYNATCTRLEHLYSETISVISLNTQAQTTLSETIKHNQYSPLVQGKAGGS